MEQVPKAKDNQSKPESEIKLKPSIFRKYGLNHPFLEYRSPFDKSGYTCVENILRDTIKSLVLVYGVKIGLALLGALLGFKKTMKNPKILLEKLIDPGHFKMACFAGTNVVVLKTAIAVMQGLRKKDDGWNGFVGGFLSGYLSMFFLKSKKTFLACFMLSRGIECIYNSIADRGYYKRSNVHWVCLYAVLMMLIGYSYAHERYLMDPGAVSGFDFATNQNKVEWAMMWLYHEMTRRRLVKNGVLKEPFLNN